MSILFKSTNKIFKIILCNLNCHMHAKCSVFYSRVNARHQTAVWITRHSNLNLYLTPKVPTRYKVTQMMYRVGMVPADKDVIEVYECTMLPSGHWSSHLDGYTILRYSSNYFIHSIPTVLHNRETCRFNACCGKCFYFYRVQ